LALINYRIERSLSLREEAFTASPKIPLHLRAAFSHHPHTQLSGIAPNFNRHLSLGGKLAFNVFYPNYALLDDVGIEHQELEWQDPNNSDLVVRRFFVRNSVDKLNQSFQGDFIFRTYQGDQLVKEDRSHLSMSYYTYPQVLLLLKISGFKVQEEYGSFTREPISVKKEMVFVAEKDREL
jgi:hypothetical protein